MNHINPKCASSSSPEKGINCKVYCDLNSWVNRRNLSDRFHFYSWFIIEEMKNVDHVIRSLVEKGVIRVEDMGAIESSTNDVANFTKTYNSIRRTPKRNGSVISTSKEILQKTLTMEIESRRLKKTTLLVDTLSLKLKSGENSTNNTFDCILNALRETHNEFIAQLLEIDPNHILVGKREWEKIILELWEDLLGLIDYNKIAPFLIEQNILSEQQNYFLSTIPHNEDRVANLLLLLSDRCQGLYWLARALQHESSHRYKQLAQLCTLLDEEELSILDCHKNFVVSHIVNLDLLVNDLYNFGGINFKDKRRITNPHRSDYQMREELVRTLNRKRPGIIDLLTGCCNRTKHEDVAIVLSFSPNIVYQTHNSHWEEVEQLKRDWDYLISEVYYEDIFHYFIFKGFISKEEHQNIQEFCKNSDKIRKVLALLPLRKGAYEAFFQALNLKPQYDELILHCLTMDFEESRRLLEVQDFLWVNLESTEFVVEKLIAVGLVDNQEANFIVSQNDRFERNLALCNILKQKQPGTVDKVLDVFWTTRNQNCASILSIDFKKLLMTSEEWTKWKVHWNTFVDKIRCHIISNVLLEMGCLTNAELQWILKSERNRRQMRKLLRIIPTKVDGYKSFLMALSTVPEKTYQDILFKCELINPNELKRFYTNYDFVMNNTTNLGVLVNDLEQNGILNELQTRIINCYNHNSQVEELYTMLLGKQKNIFRDINGSLIRSGNTDVASILNTDFSQMCINLEEWMALTKEWNTLLDTVDYFVFRTIPPNTLLTPEEDKCILACSNGPDMIRLMLRIIPFKKAGFRNLVAALMKHDNYQDIAWKLITSASRQNANQPT